MGDCVEGCREVQENEDADVTGINSDEEVIGDLLWVALKHIQPTQLPIRFSM